MTVQHAPEHLIDSRYAMWRLVKALVIMVMGSSCMFIVSVVLPEVQAEFGISRSEASLPSTLLWIGFGAGGLLMGRVSDRWGVWTCLLIGAAISVWDGPNGPYAVELSYPNENFYYTSQGMISAPKVGNMTVYNGPNGEYLGYHVGGLRDAE